MSQQSPRPAKRPQQSSAGSSIGDLIAAAILLVGSLVASVVVAAFAGGASPDNRGIGVVAFLLCVIILQLGGVIYRLGKLRQD